MVRRLRDEQHPLHPLERGCMVTWSSNTPLPLRSLLTQDGDSPFNKYLGAEGYMSHESLQDYNGPSGEGKSTLLLPCLADNNSLFL
ncbi:unnamed protein product [Boreogadus saida]